MERAVKVLDHIPPYDTHKIGVVYVGQGQVHTNFLCLKTARHHVSTLIDLAWVVPSHMHTHTHITHRHRRQRSWETHLAHRATLISSVGWVSFSGCQTVPPTSSTLEGLIAVVLMDSAPTSTRTKSHRVAGIGVLEFRELHYILSPFFFSLLLLLLSSSPSSSSPLPLPLPLLPVVYHVATLMPTHTADPHCSNKKLHIGNDFVTVVYNDSTQPYSFGTIKVRTGQKLGFLYSYQTICFQHAPPTSFRLLPPPPSFSLLRGSSTLWRWW